LRFDGDAEAIGSLGVLALKGDADRVEMILGQVFHGDGAVRAMSLIVCAAQRLTYRTSMPSPARLQNACR